MDSIDSIPFDDEIVEDNLDSPIIEDSNDASNLDNPITDDNQSTYVDITTQRDDQNNDDNDDSEINVINDFLSAHGVDPNGVNIGDEKIPFDELDHELQLDILKQLNVTQQVVNDPEVDLDDSEIDLINAIRGNGLTVDGFMKTYADRVAEQALHSQPAEDSIESLSDDELFLADLFATIEDLTEDEALQQLEIERSNPSLFEKKVKAIREDYLQKEQYANEMQLTQAQQEQEQRYKEYEATIVNTLEKSRSVDLGSTILDLSNEDLDSIASFILDADDDGVNHLEKALRDPNELVKLAFFSIKGPEIISSMDQYYKDEIAKVARYNYEKGAREAGGSTPNRKGTKSVTETVDISSKNNENGIMGIDELPFD